MAASPPAFVIMLSREFRSIATRACSNGGTVAAILPDHPGSRRWRFIDPWNARSWSCDNGLYRILHGSRPDRRRWPAHSCFASSVCIPASAAVPIRSYSISSLVLRFRVLPPWSLGHRFGAVAAPCGRRASAFSGLLPQDQLGSPSRKCSPGLGSSAPRALRVVCPDRHREQKRRPKDHHNHHHQCVT